MDNLLSIVTFLPLVGAASWTLFLRGEDEAAQLNAKRLALVATTRPSSPRSSILLQFDPQNTGFQFVEERSGFWA
jgi:NADH-quinone oxidoreductase subunit M